MDSEYYFRFFLLMLGVYRRSNNIKHFVDVNSVSELHKVSNRQSKLTIGANVSLTEMMKIIRSVAADKPDFVYCQELAKHIDLIATIPVRNVSALQQFTLHLHSSSH